MNNSSTVQTSMMESVTVALELDAGIINIDPCMAKDFFYDTNGFKGQPEIGIQKGHEISKGEYFGEFEG